MRPQRGLVKTPAKTPVKPPRSRQATGSGEGTDLDPVEVFCRIRPLDCDASEKCIKLIDDTTLQVYPTEMQYKFTKVFGETTSQKGLFDSVGASLVEDLLHGKNGLLFTYGITSSGKTYTMTGTTDEQGILPRCLDMVFNSIENVQARKYVFTPDKQNGFDVQSEADAMMERQRREIMPNSNSKSKISKEKIDFSGRGRDLSKVDDIDEDSNYAVFVSFIEIYNNYIYDLLEELPYDPITGNKPPQSKILREDLQRVMFVHNVSEVEVKSTEEAFDILVKGQKRRKVAHTVLNAESSRSHSVFNIRLVQAPLDSTGKEIMLEKGHVVVSQLSLVDLAGSERTNRTKNSGERLKEAGQINQSLMVLRQCIDTLRENQKTGANKMVPYRDSKITHLFKNYFDGEGKVRLIVCVNPKASEFDETLHVMRFAEAAQEVQVHRAHEKKVEEEALVHGRRKLAAAAAEVPAVPTKRSFPEAPASQETPLPRAPVPLCQIYTLPPWPAYKMERSNDDDLHSVQKYVSSISKLRDRYKNSVFGQQDAFRALLLTFDKENALLNSRVTCMEQTLQERDALVQEVRREKERLESRLRTLECENQSLRRRTEVYQNEKKDLEDELQNKDWALHKTDYEREQLRMEYEKQVARQEADYERQMEAEKLRIQAEAQEHLSVKERKLRLLKTIVNNSDLESMAGELADTPTVQRKPPAFRPVTPATPGYASSTIASYNRENVEKPKQPINPPQTRGRTIARPRAKSPPPAPALRPLAVRNHRRSKSAGERWLDHKPQEVMELDTVMQPKLGKQKKSVGKLEVKDTVKANKYLLTTQDMDEKGHVETKLVKGEVLTTAGGGSSVVFTEVETLKQTSPGDRKRRFVPQSRDDFEGEWTDTEERCNVAIEGHGVYKRIQQLDRSAHV